MMNSLYQRRRVKFWPISKKEHLLLILHISIILTLMSMILQVRVGHPLGVIGFFIRQIII